MTVAVEDGNWNGQPCRVATVSNLGGGVFLGCGTMLAFTSWSYMHHLRPIKEVIYIDRERNVPIHETLTSDWQQKVFEIDFADYVEVEPGQWAPRSIRIEAKDSFTCEYQFQLVAGKHWMLKEVVSWFKPEDKSRGVVEDVQIDGSRELLDDALRQVRAARTLFGGAGEIDRKVDVAAVPFVLGRAIACRALRNPRDDARRAYGQCLGFDERSVRGRHCPVVLPGREAQAAVRADDHARASRMACGGARWRFAARPCGGTSDAMAVPTNDANTARLPVNVVPFRWGETISVNIPDAGQAEVPPAAVRNRSRHTRGPSGSEANRRRTARTN